jgi:sRNA-binding protein
VRSVSASPRVLRPVAIGACLCLLGGGAAGCSTTQDKAAAKQAEAEHILKARAKRQAAKKRERAKAKHTHSKHKGKKHGPVRN